MRTQDWFFLGWLAAGMAFAQSPQQNEAKAGQEFHLEQSFSELEARMADHPAQVMDWAQKAMIGLERSRVPNQWVRLLAVQIYGAMLTGQSPQGILSQWNSEIDAALPLAKQLRLWREYDLLQSLVNQYRSPENFDAVLVEELKLLNYLFKNANIEVGLIRLSQIASMLQEKGRLMGARKYANQAKLILQQHQEFHEFRRRSIQARIAFVYLQDPDTEKEAMDLLQEVWSSFRKNKFRHALAQSTLRYAATIVYQTRKIPTYNELDGVSRLAQESIQPALDIDDTRLAGELKSLVAHAYNKQKRYLEAEQSATNAIGVIKELKSVAMLSARLALATALIEQKKYDAARDHLDKAEELGDSLDNVPLYLMVDLKKIASQFAFAQANYDKAFRYQIEYYYLDNEMKRNNRIDSQRKVNSGSRSEDESTTTEPPSSLDYSLILAVLLGLATVASAYRGFRKSREIRELEVKLESQNLLRNFHPKMVDERVLGRGQWDDRAQKRRVTILQAELVQFQEFIDKLGPEATTSLVAKAHHHLAHIVFEHDGMLDSLSGGTVRAIFGVPHPTPDREQAIRALHGAVELMQAVSDLNKTWKKEFGHSFEMRLTLCQGECILGSFGFESRSEYSALGSPIALVQGMQQLAQGGQVLIHESMIEGFQEDCERGPQGKLASGKTYQTYIYPWHLELAKSIETAG